MQKYKLVVSGATFDHFHKGHKEFIRFALDQGEEVLLGLTSDTFAKEKRHEEEIELYEIRKQSLISCLRKLGVERRVKILPIDTLFIPAEWESLSIEAIIVSKDSLAGARVINHKRKMEGRQLLTIIECPTVVAEDGQFLSSVRIRKGEINREGQLFVNPAWTFPLLITPFLRIILKKPFGSLIKDTKSWFKRRKIIDTSKIITVGDIVTAAFNMNNIEQKISVVDFLVAREKKFSSIKDHGFKGLVTVINVENPAGTLTSAIFAVSQNLFASRIGRSIILVNGEEDLAVLPLVLSAPLGFTIYYGQPNEGIVEIVVTEKKKKEAYSIVNQFTRGY